MPLLPRQQTRDRNREKTLRVLRFLRTSIYSTADLLGEVMGVKSRDGIHKSLMGMEKKGLLRRQRFHEFTGTFTLWGITPAGQQACLQEAEEPVTIFFNIAKVSLARLQHYLSMQQIRIRAEAAGWHDFVYCDRRQVFKDDTEDSIKKTNHEIRPDLLAVTPHNRKVAIESERLMKWPPRYKEHVLPAHIRRLNDGEYQQVIWVCRTREDEEKLKAILAAAIKELRNDKDQEFIRLDQSASKEYKTFAFATISSWPNF